jgi:peptidoglycan-associated lipoprotein
MKRPIFAYLLALGVVLALGGTGCKNPKKPLTPIPSQRGAPTSPGPRDPIGAGRIGDTDTGLRSTDTTITPTTEGIPTGKLEDFEGRQADREAFQAYTIYFDFDRSAIRSGESSKLQAVADYLKQNAKDDLVIEGHCDERGTSEYNRALGERRALSAREYLVNLGISASRIRTISYGEDKPAELGEGEDVWAKNRRCEFLKLLPKAE